MTLATMMYIIVIAAGNFPSRYDIWSAAVAAVEWLIAEAFEFVD